jgi:hypothetical protein
MRRSAFVCLFGLLFSAPAHAEDWVFSQDGWKLKVSTLGNIVGLASQEGQQLTQSAAGDNFIRLAVVPAGQPAAEPAKSAFVVCDRPTKIEQKATGGSFEYDLRPGIPLTVRYEVKFAKVGGFAMVRRAVTLQPTAPPLKQDVVLMVGNNIATPGAKHPVFTPRYNGQGEVIENKPDCQWVWRLSGHTLAQTVQDQVLAIPLVSESAGEKGPRITHMADPFFSTGFRLADSATSREGDFNCVYLASRVPMTQPEQRVFWTVIQSGGPEKALQAWYAIALSDVKEGPDWLHDVAWQHYDYLSHAGQGWFEDIDAAAKVIPKAERSKIVFTLHGWYDMLGRYSFDEKTGKLDDEWTAFPRAAEMKSKGFPTSETVKMTKADMHRRIRYAKEKGFRVCVYFADGLTACDGAGFNKAEEIMAPGGWGGPDTIGESYLQDPTRPKVYERYLNYLKALLGEYGREIDALVWDETFQFRAGMLAPGEGRDYPDRAMMKLVRDCAKLVSTMQPKVAFLASDCQGVTFDRKSYWLDVPPYAMMAHGCYQDSHCEPGTWPYGIFASFRNVLWSCNWQAVTRFDYTAFGVEHYQVPVATSNGWLDDKGIARLSEAELADVLKLYERRKTQRQELRWLTGPAPEMGK